MLIPNRSYFGITMLITLAVFFGCKKDTTQQNPITTSNDAENAIANLYSLTKFYGGSAGNSSTNWQMLEAVTGTSYSETEENTDLNNLYNLTYDSKTVHIANWWNGIYKLVDEANNVIENVPKVNMDKDRQKRILGEALFLRAWAYFYAVRLWGDIPLVTGVHSVQNPARAPQADVYNTIVNDLKSAETCGLPWQNGIRVSTSAVKSLLAKVYLTMAGFPLNKGNPYYQLAADKSLEVIQGFSHSLFTDYSDLHDPLKNNMGENIYQLQYEADKSGNPMNDMLPKGIDITAKGDIGTGSTVPTLSFIQSFNPGDMRVKNQVGFFFNSYYKNGFGAVVNLGKYYIFKHFNKRKLGFPYAGAEQVDFQGINDLNVPQIRLAEVYLIYAESQNNADGGLNAYSLNYVNEIKQRAELLPLGPISQQGFSNAVWTERCLELCYEGITWFDMVRLRKVRNEKTRMFENFAGHINLNVNKPLQDKNLLFPLPETAMKRNPNLKPQNPGY